MIRVITASDPSSKVDELLSWEGITDIRVDELAGRYIVNVRCDRSDELMDRLDNFFDAFGVRSIGFDEPTLEETYLYLTGGE